MTKKYRIIGAISPGANKLGFKIPVFQTDNYSNLFIQIKGENWTIAEFREIIIEYEEVDHFPSDVCAKAGDKFIFCISISEETKVFKYSEVKQIEELPSFEEMSIFTKQQYYNIIKNNMLETTARNDMLMGSSMLNHSSVTRSFLTSSITSAAWDKLISKANSSDERKEIYSNLTDIRFELNDSGAIELVSGSNFISSAENITSVITELNDEYSDTLEFIIDNSDTFQFQKKIESEVKFESLDIDSIAFRMNFITSRIGRQEERIAFMVACMMYNHNFIKIISNFRWSAQSERTFVNLVKQNLLPYDEKMKSIEIHALVRTLIRQWKTGRLMLLKMYLIKWLGVSSKLLTNVYGNNFEIRHRLNKKLYEIRNIKSKFINEDRLSIKELYTSDLREVSNFLHELELFVEGYPTFE